MLDHSASLLPSEFSLFWMSLHSKSTSSFSASAPKCVLSSLSFQSKMAKGLQRQSSCLFGTTVAIRREWTVCREERPPEANIFISVTIDIYIDPSFVPYQRGTENLKDVYFCSKRKHTYVRKQSVVGTWRESACFRQMTDRGFPQVFFISVASISTQGAGSSNSIRCNEHTGLSCVIKANIYIKHNTAIYLDA